jgi:hypothetical protein
MTTFETILRVDSLVTHQKPNIQPRAEPTDTSPHDEEMDSCNDGAPDEQQDQSSFAEEDEESEGSGDHDDDCTNEDRATSAKRPRSSALRLRSRSSASSKSKLWEKYSRDTRLSYMALQHQELKAEINELNERRRCAHAKKHWKTDQR